MFGIELANSIETRFLSSKYGGAFMKTYRFVVPLAAAGLVLGLFAVPGIAQQAKPEAKQPPAKTYIPKEVKDILAQNISTRQTRQDIPFTIFKQLYLPARDASYIYFFFKMKNGDLGFTPAPAVPGAPADAPAKLRAVFDVFLQFHQETDGKPTKVIKEVYVPVTLEKDAAGFDPNAEDWYTIGYPLMPGSYLLAAGIASRDLKRIGTGYCDFTLPDNNSFTKALDTTPIIFLKDYKELSTAETVAELHAGFLRYAILQISPNIDNTIAVGDTLDTFFYIYGAKPDASGAYNIECQFDVLKDEEPAIKFALQPYQNPFISQPLPMKQTLLTKTTDEKGEPKETQKVQDLPAGTYTFSVQITDKISGLTCAKKVGFTIVDKTEK
jgi:hypothetical protein